MLALLTTTLVAAACTGAADEDASADEAAITELDVWMGEWNLEDRKKWYLTPQGSALIDYSVFKSLEQAESQTRFTDKANLTALGFLYPPSGTEAAFSMDGLPLGVVKDKSLLDSKDYVGLTCAGCHTGQVKVKQADGTTRSWLVDGGQANIEFERFFDGLQKSLTTTTQSKEKFDRFCVSLGDAKGCKARLQTAKERIDGLISRNKVTTESGPGRLDAVSRILNELVASHFGSPADLHPVTAPISYPHVWDAPRLSCVQTNCLSHNPLTRNVGEVLGVFGQMKVGETLPFGEAKVPSPTIVGTPKIDNLHTLEASLRTYKGPKWRNELGALNPDKVKNGEKTYSQACASCHTRPWLFDSAKLAASNNPRDKEILKANFEEEEVGGKKNYYPLVTLTDFKEVGTDPAFITDHASKFSSNEKAVEVFDATLKRRIAEGIQERRFIGDLAALPFEFNVAFELKKREQIKQGVRKSDGSILQLLLLGGATSTLVETHFRPQVSSRESERTATATRIEFQEGRSSIPPVVLTKYRARPLNGIAFTAPFGHNGSWPTLRSVIDPATRPAKFPLRPGSFDPKDAGLDLSPVAAGEKVWTFDTSIRANANSGHAYGSELSAAAKEDLLEYLKSL